MILPSALYSNEAIPMPMLHATTVPDLPRIARDANPATCRSFESFGLAALIDCAVSFVPVAAFRRAETRWPAHLVVRKR